MLSVLKKYLRKSNFLIVFIFFKRLKIVVLKLWKSILLNFFWFIKSKEHTNFSFEINTRSLWSLKYYLKNNFNYSFSEINDVVEYALNSKIKKSDIFNLPFSQKNDLDLGNHWDYRLLPFILFTLTDIKYLVELGVSHGRLGYLIHSNKNLLTSFKKYIGVENNERKAGLIDNYTEDTQFNLFRGTVEDYFQTENLKTIEESILVCSTHEKKSEEFIFKFLTENKLSPLIIISDNSKPNSDYFNFVINNESYTTDILTFTDKNNFFSPLFIGVSYQKFLTETTS